MCEHCRSAVVGDQGKIQDQETVKVLCKSAGGRDDRNYKKSGARGCCSDWRQTCCGGGCCNGTNCCGTESGSTVSNVGYNNPSYNRVPIEKGMGMNYGTRCGTRITENGEADGGQVRRDGP